MLRRPITVPGGLRLQVLLPAVLLCLGAMIVVVQATLKVTEREQMRQARERALSHASLLVETLPKEPRALLGRALPQHAQDAGLDFVAWQDSDGQIFVSHRGELEELGMAFLATTSLQKPSITRTYTLSHTTYMFTSLRGRRGQVVIATDLRSVQESIALARTSAYLFTSLTLVLLLVLGYAVFTFLVIRPIKTLSVATERASQGDFASPVSLLPANELGQLARQFNLMLEQLTRQRAQLLEQVRQLEETNTTLLQTQQSLILSEKLASVGQLAAGVAHEVGNPLAAVHGYAELLGDGDIDADELQLIAGRISKQVERIRRIIRELLDYSRTEEDTEREYVMGPFSLSECVEEALELARATGKLKHIDVLHDEEGRAPNLPIVHGNTSQTMQVLLNLILNAADALQCKPDAPPLYRLYYEIDEERELLALYLEDNGPGIPDHLATRIFDPFFTTKDPGKGTGLGLAISSRIMQRMRGHLELVHGKHPELGGASFRLLFQLVTDSSSLDDAAHHDASTPS